MMTMSRQQGAVHIMFLIITLVIALAGWGLWFTQYSENEGLKADAAAATADRVNANEKVLALIQSTNAFIKAVGDGELSPIAEPADGQDPRTYVESFKTSHVRPVENRVGEARASLNADATLVTLMAMLTPAEAAINARDAQIAALTNDVAQARGDRSSAESANDALISGHRNELERRNTDETNLRQANAAREQALEGQKDDLTGKLQKTTDDAEAAAVAHREALAKARDEVEELDRQVREVTMGLRMKMETDKPDGKILDVDYRAGTCYIDIGSKHMLRRGTRFNTYGFLKGAKKDFHGYIVVRDVERDRALCAIEGDAQVQRGDWVTNPYFDTEEMKQFFFLGALPGRFDNQRAKSILESFNGKVLEGFSPHADFLVLGENPDPEAVGENANPNWFKETEEYADALRWNIEIIRAKDLEIFLQY